MATCVLTLWLIVMLMNVPEASSSISKSGELSKVPSPSTVSSPIQSISKYSPIPPTLKSSQPRLRASDSLVDYGLPTTFRKCVNEDHIALTFDDGPNALTLDLLNVLDKYNAKATFFFVGVNYDLESVNKEAVRQVYERGHQVASHLWSHPHMAQLNHDEIIAELRKNSDALFDIIGARPRYMRPPYGNTNKLSVKTVMEESYKSMLWSCDSHDWRLTSSAAVLRNMNKCGLKGLVLLLHEGRQSTVDAVEQFVKRITEEFPTKRFVRADECSGFPGDGYFLHM